MDDTALGQSRTRRNILALLQEPPGQRLHLRAIARRVGASPGNTSRELRRLQSAGMVVRSREGAQVYFELPADTEGTTPDALGLAIGRRLADGLRSVYGERLRGVYLYGSRARGDNRPDSDVDILVVLDRIEDHGTDLRRSSGLASDLSLEHGVTVSRLLIPEAVWESGERPIVKAVAEEAIPL